MKKEIRIKEVHQMIDNFQKWSYISTPTAQVKVAHQLKKINVFDLIDECFRYDVDAMSPGIFHGWFHFCNFAIIRYDRIFSWNSMNKFPPICLILFSISTFGLLVSPKIMNSMSNSGCFTCNLPKTNSRIVNQHPELWNFCFCSTYS